MHHLFVETHGMGRKGVGQGAEVIGRRRGPATTPPPPLASCYNGIMSDRDERLDRWCRWSWAAFCLAMLLFLLPGVLSMPYPWLIAFGAFTACSLWWGRHLQRLAPNDLRPLWVQTLDTFKLVAMATPIVVVFLLLYLRLTK
jgi:hypothetical protein